MIHAGAREDLPLIGRYRALIANRQRGEYTGVGPVRQSGKNARTQFLACGFNPVRGPVHKVIDAAAA